MKSAPVMIGVLVLWSQAVMAQQTLSPALEHVTVSGQDCVRLVNRSPANHVPAPDVAYKAGVDVHGRPVAPADLPGSGGTYKPPETVEFDYTVNPTAYSGAAKSGAKWATAGNTQMPVAHIRFDLASNRFLLDGQPIGEADERGLAEECRRKGIR